jgi:hypothetical protein
MNQCINCQAETAGKFCANCGQRTSVKRITFREGWNDFWARVYGFDGMFPRTLKDLTIKPGEAARSFIAGNRAKYYAPVGYFFFVVSLYLLTMSVLNISTHEIVSAMGANNAKPGSGQDQFNNQMFTWINDNQRLVAFLMIPFYVLGAKIFFRKESLNFLEHSVLVFYSQGHIQWLSILALFTFSWLGIFPGFLLFVSAQILHYSFACMQLYRAYSPWKAFFRGILVNLFFWICFIIVIVLGFVIAMALDPDLLEQIRPKNQ